MVVLRQTASSFFPALSTGVIKALLKAGRDIHSRDQQGNTRLHIALARGRVERAELLIERICCSFNQCRKVSQDLVVFFSPNYGFSLILVKFMGVINWPFSSWTFLILPDCLQERCLERKG